MGSCAPPRNPSSHHRPTCSFLPLMEADPAASTPGDGSVVNAPYRVTRFQAAGAAPRPRPVEPELLRGCEAAAVGKRLHLAAAGPGPSRHRGWGFASPTPHRPRGPGHPTSTCGCCASADTRVPSPAVGWGPLAAVAFTAEQGVAAGRAARWGGEVLEQPAFTAVAGMWGQE